MRRELVYEAWAPDASPWSPWVKPVLFAEMADDEPTGDPSELLATVPDNWWAPEPERRVAIVVDVAGAASALIGLALARRGYRPVPLFNCVSGRRHRGPTAIDVEPVMRAVAAGPSILEGLPAEAPPAFLLDSRRANGDSPLAAAGELDNRWVCFASDFPSATFMLSHDVRSACVIVSTGRVPAVDLSHALRRWDEQGLGIEIKALDDSEPPQHLDVPKPPYFRLAWQRLAGRLGLTTRHSLHEGDGGYRGGFGSFG